MDAFGCLRPSIGRDISCICAHCHTARIIASNFRTLCARLDRLAEIGRPRCVVRQSLEAGIRLPFVVELKPEPAIDRLDGGKHRTKLSLSDRICAARSDAVIELPQAAPDRRCNAL